MNSTADPRARLLLLIPHLGIGGSQQVVATLARHLDATKYELHLCLITQSDPITPQLPGSVQIHFLAAKRTRYAATRLLRLVWTLKPALIFVGMTHVSLLVLLLRPLFPPGTRVIIRQNGSLSASLQAAGPPTLSRLLYAIAYRTADAIVCQTDFTSHELRTRLRLQTTRMAVHPNPVDIERIRQAAAPSNPCQQEDLYLLAVGRLVPEKGFDLLLQAFAAITADFPTLRLRIAGAGPCLSALKAQCRQLNLGDRIDFLGSVERFSLYPSNARAFVLSSRQDELPNALLEAAAGGLPIVATPASPGVASLLRDQPGVWLANDSSAPSLTSALRKALGPIHPRQRFTHEWVFPFALKTAVAAYESLIDSILDDR